MLQPRPRLRLDQALRYFDFHRLLHWSVLSLILTVTLQRFTDTSSPLYSFLALVLARAYGTRCHSSGHSSRKAFPVIVTDLRSLLDSNLISLGTFQLGIRRSSLHRYWSWFRYYEDFVRHPLLEVRWTVNLSGNEDTLDAVLHHVDFVDSSLYVSFVYLLHDLV